VDKALSSRSTTVLPWRAASRSDKFSRAIFPYLLNHLKTCRPKDVAQHSEKILVAVSASNKAAFVNVLKKRQADLSGGGLARVKKVIQQAEARA
jgi:hypothetical protein